MNIILALFAIAAFLLAIQPLSPVRFLIAAAALVGFMLLTASDPSNKPPPKARTTYRAFT